MLRFFKNLLIHPGTWVFGSVALLGMGILFPPAAPILAAVAVGGFSVGGLACFPYILNFFDFENRTNAHKGAIEDIKHFL